MPFFLDGSMTWNDILCDAPFVRRPMIKGVGSIHFEGVMGHPKVNGLHPLCLASWGVAEDIIPNNLCV